VPIEMRIHADPGLFITKFGDIKYEYFDTSPLFIVQGEATYFHLLKTREYTYSYVKIKTLDPDPQFESGSRSKFLADLCESGSGTLQWSSYPR
jgi:hypothetical protein